MSLPINQPCITKLFVFTLKNKGNKAMIYRKRIKKNRFGIKFGKKSFQLHFGKRSVYFFVPFWNVKVIVDTGYSTKIV